LRLQLVNLITASALCAAALLTAPAAQAQELGGIDFHRFCVENRDQFQGDVGTENLPTKAHSWQCVYTPFSGPPIEMPVNTNLACSQQYGPGAWSRAGDRRDPNSWRCYR